MSWEDLRNTRWLTPRPITTWPGEMTPASDRRRSPFSARWLATKATHPDHGGDPADFLAVQAAREKGATS